jgi:putative ABC transport system permease protein
VTPGARRANQRELGVRSALGAPRTTLVGMVVREGMAVMLAGAVAGVAGAAAMARLMQALLFGVEPLDAWSFAGAVIVLTGVALVACVIPAARAAGVDPATALRTE